MDNKLLYIQTKLKAPKSQFNDFGKYKYRNCEDVLEALKPLLAETETTVLLSDEIVQIGERYYVQTSAVLGGDKGMLIAQTKALAREEETKKGMDGAQITGAASSYARKCALSGLFAIDDNRDADSNGQDVEKAHKTIKRVLKDRKFPLLGKAGEELTPDEWLREFINVDAVEKLSYEQAKKVYLELVRLEGGTQ